MNKAYGINKIILRCAALLSCLLLGFSNAAIAEEVTIKSNGLTLNANLELAEGKQISDGIVLIMHSFLAHNRMEIIETSQRAFLDNGQSSLAINVSLGVDNRHGFYDCMVPITHKLSDAMDELDAWINWLKSNGAEHITLMGHSISANQVLTYAVQRQNRAINGLILLAPNTVGHPSSPERYKAEFGNDLDDVLQRAEKLVKEGKGKELMKETDFGFCPKSGVTAEAFYDFYHKGNKFWNAHLFLPDVKVPVLIVAASDDERQPKIPENVQPYVDDKHVSMVIIDGADHFFRDFNIDQAIEAAVAFQGQL